MTDIRGAGGNISTTAGGEVPQENLADGEGNLESSVHSESSASQSDIRGGGGNISTSSANEISQENYHHVLLLYMILNFMI